MLKEAINATRGISPGNEGETAQARDTQCKENMDKNKRSHAWHSYCIGNALFTGQPKEFHGLLSGNSSAQHAIFFTQAFSPSPHMSKSKASGTQERVKGCGEHIAQGVAPRATIKRVHPQSRGITEKRWNSHVIPGKQNEIQAVITAQGSTLCQETVTSEPRMKRRCKSQ